MLPVYEKWGPIIRKLDDDQRMKTWELARNVYNAIKEAVETTSDGYRRAFVQLSKTCGISHQRVRILYEVIARMNAWGLEAIVSDPNSYFGSVQVVAMTYTLTGPDKQRLIKAMHEDDKDAATKTSQAQAQFYTKRRGTELRKHTSIGDTAATPSSDFETVTQFANALESVYARSGKLPEKAKALKGYRSIPTLIAELRSMENHK